MRIAIDARPLTAEKAGIGFYTDRLLRALAEAAPHDEFYLFSNREIFFSGPGNCRLIVQGSKTSNIWLQSALPRLLQKYQNDLLHSTMFLMPLLTHVPTVITVHDMVYKLFPETTNWRNRIVLQALLPISMKKAAKIIAVSENTKKDIIRFHSVDPEKIEVIYLGSEHNHHMERRQADNFLKDRRSWLTGNIAGGARDYSDPTTRSEFPERYILTVGTLEPRKNLVCLFQAFAMLLQDYPQMEHKLVVVGAKGWRYGDVFATIKALDLDKKVLFTEYVAQDTLQAIYRGADLFVFPSLYEGFGLPPLEAMSAGVPVICSNAGSLPEVVGEAAVLVDPHDAVAISRAMAAVLTDPQQQELMRLAGLQQAKLFSWKRSAEQTLDVYREVMR